MNLKLLILDDDDKITTKLAEYFSNKGYGVKTALNYNQADEIIQCHEIDIAIIDVVLPDINGIQVLEKIKKKRPEIEVIMMSGYGDMDMVIEAMKHGAVDFIRKPFSTVEIQIAVERTKKFVQIQSELEQTQNKYSLLTRELEQRIERELIGLSNQIKKLYNDALIIAEDGNANVLITGENGTGKEIIARIIHHASPRKNHPFSAVNCSAIPETLLESEFFGHRRGAFTDAKETRKGYFELADGGSLFLDEIADMPAVLQSKLLRVIEEKKIKQVGGDKEFSVNVRLISATNRNIYKVIEEKKFRLDLFHRINTFIIHLPPLRERPNDIEPLIKHFIKKFAREKGKQVPKIEKQVIENLKNYSFPGNIRELKNMVERAMILSTSDQISTKEFFSQNILKSEQSINFNLVQHELKLIKDALEHADYNQKNAANLLGISRDSLIRRMRKHSIHIYKSFEE